jgi:hypothetical protein
MNYIFSQILCENLCNKLLCGDVFVEFVHTPFDHQIHQSKKKLQNKIAYLHVTFFEKVKILEPLMAAKLSSKTHLQKPLIIFSSHSVPFWLQSLLKVLI